MNYSNTFSCDQVGKVRHRLFWREGVKAWGVDGTCPALARHLGRWGTIMTRQSPCAIIGEGSVVWPSPLYSLDLVTFWVFFQWMNEILENMLYVSFMNNMFNLITIFWNKYHFHFTDKDRVFAVGFSKHDLFVCDKK